MHSSAIGERVVVIRYGELFLKSEAVKRRFINILLENISRALREEELEYRMEIPRGRIIIHGEHVDTIARVSARVFGVVDTGICHLTPAVPEDISRMAVICATRRLTPGMSFAVKVKRQIKKGMTSPELAAYIGSEILHHISGVRVDLENPEYTIQIEVREIGGLIWEQRLAGPGGLPLGTQGKCIALLSSGIDSPVAAWLMMKRGCIPEFLFFDSGEWSGEDVRNGAVENLRRLSLWCPGFPLNMHIVPNEHLFHRMNERKIPPRFRCVICKRFMYRVGSAIVHEGEALVLVTGENLGQVASQTLANLATISDAANVPLIRPLITYDKAEIISRGRGIGTFPGSGGDLSCRAVPQKPATDASRETVHHLEEKLDLSSLVAEALSRRVMISALSGEVTGRDS